MAKGMRILARQFQTRYGEIDLIAQDGEEIVFVEVKARRSGAFGYPEESVTSEKLEKIVRAGHMYLQTHGNGEAPFRIDVIAIEEGATPPKITHMLGVGD